MIKKLVSNLFYPDHSLDTAYLFRNILELGQVKVGLLTDHVFIQWLLYL